jgi:hypothetical protein
MISRTTAVWGLLALATPCPVSILLCNGLLPPVIVLGVIAMSLAREPYVGWVVAGPLALELALLLWLLRLIAKRLVARLSERALAAAVATVLVAAMMPLYSWDCMDGHGLTRCSVPGILLAAVAEGRQCGDLGW